MLFHSNVQAHRKEDHARLLERMDAMRAATVKSRRSRVLVQRKLGKNIFAN